MSGREGLSRPAAWLLARLLPAEVADALAGDLEERLRAEIRPARGRLRAELWVWGQILTLRLPALWRVAGRGRERRGVIAGTWADLRQAARSLRREPGFVVVVAGTLGVAIGATTLAFSIVDGVLLRPLPWPDQERLVELHATNAALRASDTEVLRALADRMPVSYPQMRDWAERTDLFAAVGAVRAAQATVDIGGEAERLSVPGVTAGLFATLGVTPALGRVFAEDEDGAVVLSWGTWQRRFGGDPGVLGRTIRIRDEPHTVVGVMPGEFWFPDPDAGMWTTLAADDRSEDRRRAGLAVVARLRAGVSPEQAQAALDALAARLADALPEQADLGARVVPLRDEVVGGVARTLFVLFGAVALVLLVACTNVANLMLVRSTTRAREFAVRSALGAGRARLLRAGFAEGLLLALAGGAAGLLLAAAGLRPLLAVVPASVPRLDEVGLDARVLAFGAALALLAAAGVGLLPGWRASRAAPQAALRESGRTASRSRRMGRAQSALVLAQVATACVLTVGGALLVTSYGRLLGADRGFEPDGLALWPIVLPVPAYADDARADAFFATVAERVAGMPGVSATAWSSEAPFSSALRASTLRVPGSDLPETTVEVANVSPGYLELLRAPLLAGRTLSVSDRSDGPAIVVSRAFAQRYWPGESALGRTVLLGAEGTPHSIVGVVGDVRADASQPPGPKLYAPLDAGGRRILVLRTALPAAALATSLRALLRDLDPAIPPREPVVVSQALRESVATERFRALFIGGLAVCAAFLALVGVYGLVAWRVASNLPDIGVRLALGAGGRRVVRSIVGEGLRLAAAGTAIGLVLAIALTRVIASFLFGVAPTDPATLVATALCLPAVAVLASWLPARRAARIDPARVLTLM